MVDVSTLAISRRGIASHVQGDPPDLNLVHDDWIAVRADHHLYALLLQVD